MAIANETLQNDFPICTQLSTSSENMRKLSHEIGAIYFLKFLSSSSFLGLWMWIVNTLKRRTWQLSLSLGAVNLFFLSSYLSCLNFSFESHHGISPQKYLLICILAFKIDKTLQWLTSRFFLQNTQLPLSTQNTLVFHFHLNKLLSRLKWQQGKLLILISNDIMHQNKRHQNQNWVTSYVKSHITCLFWASSRKRINSDE